MSVCGTGRGARTPGRGARRGRWSVWRRRHAREALIYVKQKPKVCGVSAGARTAHSARRTDVDDVALAVDHDVPVVSVLDLEDVAGDGVGGHGLEELF